MTLVRKKCPLYDIRTALAVLSAFNDLILRTVMTFRATHSISKMACGAQHVYVIHKLVFCLILFRGSVIALAIIDRFSDII